MAYKRRLRFDKRIRFKKKMGILYILLFVVLATLSVGYAYINSDLKINGTANIIEASWDVHFENLQVRTGSVTASTPASVTSTTTVSFAATLDNPNDFYEFTVDVVNDGTMDAMIDSFGISPTLTTAQKKYLEYTITYFDGAPLANKQELKTGETETIRVRFSYKENSDKTNYPTEDQTFTISFTVNYTQADNTTETIRNYLYRSNTNQVYFEDNVSDLGTYYTTYQDMVSNTGKSIFLRHRISNNKVVQSDVGFIYNNSVYYLLGAGATYSSVLGDYNPDSPYYETNKALLDSVFGSSNCSESPNNGYPYYTCSVSGFDAYANSSGRVYATYNWSWSCDVYGGGNATENGSSRCLADS